MLEYRKYYSVAGISAEEVIDGLNMLHREGAPVKYFFRCNTVLPKGNIKEDLKKSLHYLERCYTLEPPIRDKVYNHYVDKIDSSIFTENIYGAILEMIAATSCYGEDYKYHINQAKKYILDEYNRY